jgi:hypothetical protein
MLHITMLQKESVSIKLFVVKLRCLFSFFTQKHFCNVDGGGKTILFVVLQRSLGCELSSKVKFLSFI